MAMMTHEPHPVRPVGRVAYKKSTVRMTEAALPTGASVDADMSTRTKTELEGTDNRQRKKYSSTTQGSKKQGEYFAHIRL
jgi:hypothetical protein